MPPTKRDMCKAGIPCGPIAQPQKILRVSYGQPLAPQKLLRGSNICIVMFSLGGESRKLCRTLFSAQRTMCIRIAFLFFILGGGSNSSKGPKDQSPPLQGLGLRCGSEAFFGPERARRALGARGGLLCGWPGHWQRPPFGRGRCGDQRSAMMKVPGLESVRW